MRFSVVDRFRYEPAYIDPRYLIRSVAGIDPPRPVSRRRMRSVAKRWAKRKGR